MLITNWSNNFKISWPMGKEDEPHLHRVMYEVHLSTILSFLFFFFFWVFQLLSLPGGLLPRGWDMRTCAPGHGTRL